MSRLQEILIGIFLWAFSYFVLILFNWSALFSCRKACADLSVIATDQESGFLYLAFVYSFLLVLAAMVGQQVLRSFFCSAMKLMLAQVLAFVKDFEQLKEFRDFLDFRLGVPDEQVSNNEDFFNLKSYFQYL